MLNTAYFTVPELTLSTEEVTELLGIFNNEASNGYYYQSQNGNLTNLLVVYNYKKSMLIERLEQLFRPDICKGSYFVANYGSDRHCDDMRRCVISIELQNECNIPVTYHINNTEHDLYYNGNPIAINVELEHSAKLSSTMRIFFQFHLNEKYSFDEYREMYANNQMFWI